MNIFVLNEDPEKAARDMCNKHIVKMLIESTQIMCTVFRLSMEDRWSLSAKNINLYPRLYKATHINHPAVKWVNSSVHNTDWMWQHLLATENEYNFRYNKSYEKQYKVWPVIRELEQVRWNIWKNFGDWRQHTSFVQCMPDQYKTQDAVAAYRAFYHGEKAKFAKWKPHADEPIWWQNKSA